MNFLFKTFNGLRVLLYHKVSYGHPDAMNVTPEQFESHIHHIKKKNYTILSLEEALSANFKHHTTDKLVVFTFDDAYQNCFEYAYPILKSENVPATFFIPTAYVGGKSLWDHENADTLMCINVLKAMDKKLISFGLHSHEHLNFSTTSIEKIEQDLSANVDFFHHHQLDYLPAFAYPYGKRPKTPHLKNLMISKMADLGIKYGFRIGNRINKWPIHHPYEMERIDVRGTDSLQNFNFKIQFGKLI